MTTETTHNKSDNRTATERGYKEFEHSALARN